MHAIETTAVLEDPQHLRLTTPLLESVTGEIKVILLWPGQNQTSWPAGFFEQTYGSCGEYPIKPPAELAYETDRIPLL